MVDTDKIGGKKIYGIYSCLIIMTFLILLAFAMIHNKSDLIQIAPVILMLTLFLFNIVVIDENNIHIYGFFSLIKKKCNIRIDKIKKVTIYRRVSGQTSGVSINFWDAKNERLGDFISALIFFERKSFIRRLKSLNIEIEYIP